MSIESLLEQILDELKNIHEKLSSKEPKVILENGKRFLTVSQFSAQHSWPSEGGLRYIIFNKQPFKAELCFKKVGRRVLVDEQEFLKWIENNPKYKFKIDEVLPHLNKG